MATETPEQQRVMVKEMSWDPITRIVGSLGIHTEIDFTNQQVLKCYSTSMIFRGFDIFMKGIDPRDAHFITSRICGICGDNHCTCSCLNHNMAYGVKPPALGDLAFNLAETADYIFDHAIFNDCMANVDFCEQMVKETNPTLLAKAEQTPAPGRDIHGFKTIADIMRALNPFTGEFYLETLHVARYTREMYCLFGGRHTHPSTIMLLYSRDSAGPVARVEFGDAVADGSGRYVQIRQSDSLMTVPGNAEQPLAALIQLAATS